jgi:hypothetical protein
MSLDSCRSLSDILDTVAARVSEQSGRASVLLVEDGMYRVHTVPGPGEASSSPDQSVVSPADAHVADIAIKRRAAFVTDGSAPTAADADRHALAPWASDLEIAAVPLIVGGTVVAVLYAERSTSTNPAASQQTRASGDWAQRDRPRIVNMDAWAAAVETVARYAARSLEVLAASRAAQLAVSRHVLQPSTATAAPTSTREDEEQAARRYARLLISEIKLYHEPEVMAGRRERDLAARLGGEIMRARALYEQRVSARTRGGADYFNEELVRTLADGDASLLAQS